MVLPMEIIGPVLGFGAIITFIVAGVLAVRVFSAKLPRPGLGSGARDEAQDQVLEDMQVRLGELEELKHRVGELEERLDFTERLLAKPREGQ